MAAVPGMNFMQKPAKGWLHCDNTIRGSGVVYLVKYVGCIEVRASMKKLDFDTRFLVAKECIRKVCEATGFRTIEKVRKEEKKISSSMLGNRARMEHAGASIKLNISSKCISLLTNDGNKTVAVHDMPKISFASGGDSESHDFVAYVAKDEHDLRACYVLECGRGMAQDVITTIGQAFELRFKDYLTSPDALGLNNRCLQEADREYYNDLPGKVPPDLGGPVNGSTHMVMSAAAEHRPRERIPSTNLIDLNSEVPPPPHLHEYVNDVVFNPRPAPHDVFDLQSFEVSLSNEASQLEKEDWFHGKIDRPKAESLLKVDGDFLVRESSCSGQYILTGLQAGAKKHLLLIDPEGVVRTKDRVFDSVTHLINYHYNNQLPIISAESALILRNPVTRSQSQFTSSHSIIHC